MVHIQKEAFAEQLRKHYGTKQFDERSIDKTLGICMPRCVDDQHAKYHVEGCQALVFCYSELFVKLIERAYDNLAEKPDFTTYARAIAEAVQEFAQPFATGRHLCYPHFLMHAIDQQTLEQVVEKLKDNARIVHETLQHRKEIIRPPLKLEHELTIGFESGLTDDYFGVSSFMFHNGARWASSANGYLAKFGFFVDKTFNEVIGINVQGQTCSQIRDLATKKPIRNQQDKQKGREYARLTAALGMDPRAYVIVKAMELLKSRGFGKIKAIKPQHHPSFIEGHEGFNGRYEPVIRQAGITTDNGCYLEKTL